MNSSDERLIKISFTGDIMCEMPLLHASRIKEREYNFDKVFSNMIDVFQESDYVVGNLETICAGENHEFTNHIYSFNTPNEFIAAIKNSGIDLVTTATNHSLDRGLSGLIENLNTLDKYKLKNIGTYRDKENSERLFVEKIGDLKIAYLNYTFGTNAHINGIELTNEELHHIKLLKPQANEIKKYKDKMESKKLKPLLVRNIFKLISLKSWINIKRKFGLSYNRAYQDNDLSNIDQSFLEQLKKDIKKAKKNSDLVVMCMHSGGQFHPEPGEFSKYMMKFMDENGVDVVVGNHPHVVQKMERFTNNMFGAYSLGNFSISPGSVYVLHHELPDYSVMLHLYIGNESKEIERITFSILKIVEYEDGNLTVFPIEKLYESVNLNEKEEIIKNTTKIYNRFSMNKVSQVKIEKEYEIHIDNERNK